MIFPARKGALPMIIRTILVFMIFTCSFFIKAHCLQNSELVEVGRGTYGDPVIASWDNKTKVKIGNYCSIAGGTIILLGGEHRHDWVTTYPFSALHPAAFHIPGHPHTKGDVHIGNDVWIGINALILSGVTIGDGAVIGANAVVSKDVPPYAIVAGNPAKIVKYRFDRKTIQKLLKISWWYWPEAEIVNTFPYLLSNDINRFIHYCELTGKL